MPVLRRSCLLAVAVLLVAPRAHAAAGDAAAAQARFDEGKQLMDEGRFTLACPKFEESQRLDPGLGTQFHLADCLQHVGRTASAWSAFLEVESQARALQQTAREHVAHDRAAALEPFLSRLVVLPQAATTPGLTIRRDGVEVPHEQWGVPVPIDPGSHAVAAAAPGRRDWQIGVEVAMDGKVVTVGVPALVEVGSVATTAPPPPAPPSIPQPATATPVPAGKGVTSMMAAGASETPVVENRGGTQRAAGWFFVGAGVVSLGVGAYFTSQWIDHHNQSNAHCNRDQCDAVGTQLRHDATTLERGTIIAGGAGVASLVLGAILTATAPSPRLVSTPAAALTIVPIVDAHRGGLGLNGVW
jgi:hypothetical protein